MHDPALTPLRWTFSWPVIRNSLIVGAIVGTVLNMINQGDHITGDGAINWFKLGLTYCVPFCVGHLRRLRRGAAIREADARKEREQRRQLMRARAYSQRGSRPSR